MAGPFQFTIDATAEELPALRTRIGVPATAQLGRFPLPDLVVEWKATPAGLEITARPNPGARRTRAELEAQIRAYLAS